MITKWKSWIQVPKLSSFHNLDFSRLVDTGYLLYTALWLVRIPTSPIPTEDYAHKIKDGAFTVAFI